MRKININDMMNTVSAVIEKRGNQDQTNSKIIGNMIAGGVLGGAGMGAWAYYNNSDNDRRSRIRKALLSASIGATGGSFIGGGYGAMTIGKTDVGGRRIVDIRSVPLGKIFSGALGRDITKRIFNLGKPKDSDWEYGYVQR